MLVSVNPREKLKIFDDEVGYMVIFISSYFLTFVNSFILIRQKKFTLRAFTDQVKTLICTGHALRLIRTLS